MKMPKVVSIIGGAMLSLWLAGQASARCDSFGASMNGDWKPATSAPRDGTVVEMLETYGAAPTFGLFKWEMDKNFGPTWRSVADKRMSVRETECLFWRPYKAPQNKPYVDPTGGAQNTTAYWCRHMGIPYDQKNDRCRVP